MTCKSACMAYASLGSFAKEVGCVDGSIRFQAVACKHSLLVAFTWAADQRKSHFLSRAAASLAALSSTNLAY